MRKKIVSALTCALLLAGCGSKINEEDPIDVLYNFILLCEEGKLEDAEKLLAENHKIVNLRVFKREMDNPKDLLYIDYDYKGNDDVLELTFEHLKEMSSPTIAVVKMNSNYKKQRHQFEKNVVLHMENAKWRIYDFKFGPVRVD
ncbi:MAG: hypothetical protein GX282_08545 [Campylobacteraceae bacterium]|nr:hypothetical protein [Campylobacteraceae bacterium]